mmetsp:Transcript_51523/g.170729  ORF Transcript_51523/g.170729 Transcript_51523/m.170729 type:complete len:285 (-) Transcript_51523:302-1156(-)
MLHNTTTPPGTTRRGISQKALSQSPASPTPCLSAVAAPPSGWGARLAANKRKPSRNSLSPSPWGVRTPITPCCVSASLQRPVTCPTWSPQLQSSKKSIRSNRTPVASRSSGKWVAHFCGDSGACLPIMLTSRPSQSRMSRLHTLTPGSTSSMPSAARPTRSAKRVFADDARATRMPGKLPSACSCSAMSAPRCRLIRSPPLSTPTTPSPRPLRSPRTSSRPGSGTCAISNISLSHRQASRSKTHRSGSTATAAMRTDPAREEPPAAAAACWGGDGAAACGSADS